MKDLFLINVEMTVFELIDLLVALEAINKVNCDKYKVLQEHCRQKLDEFMGVIQEMEMCFGELYEKYGQYSDWYRGGWCNGYSCSNYKTCKGRQEFDKLPKHAPTDYELDEAISRERELGAWDREHNYY